MPGARGTWAAAAWCLLTAGARAQPPTAPGPTAPAVALQPLAQQARSLASTLSYLGQPFTADEQKRIDDAIGEGDERAAAERLQEALDAHVLAIVQINAESRVSVARGPARAELVEGGTRIFLVKVLNLAGVTAPLVVESPNSGRVYMPSWESTFSAEPVQTVTARDVGERWADIALYRTDVNVYSAASFGGRLTGLPVEYQLLQVYSRDRGRRSALLRFGVGQGSQDLGFRSEATNPVFAVVDGKPIRASRRSAEWCLAAVGQCWTQKAPKIAAGDLEAARRAYDHAREVYRARIAESDPDR